MAMITVLNTSLNLAAFAFASQSLLATFGSVSLLWNLLVSKLFHREEPGVYEYIGTAIALCGVTLCTVFGPRVTADYNSRKLESLYQQTVFIVYAVIFASLIIFFFISMRQQVSFRRLSAAAFPGCFGGLTALFSKSVVELIKSASRGGDDFKRALPYLLIVAAVVSAVTQIVFLNKCIAKFDPLFIVPVYQSSILLSSAALGIVYFQEYRNLTALDLGLFALGVTITLIALAIFANRPVQPKALIGQYTPSPSQSEHGPEDVPVPLPLSRKPLDSESSATESSMDAASDADMDNEKIELCSWGSDDRNRKAWTTSSGAMSSSGALSGGAGALPLPAVLPSALPIAPISSVGLATSLTPRSASHSGVSLSPRLPTPAAAALLSAGLAPAATLAASPSVLSPSVFDTAPWDAGDETMTSFHSANSQGSV